MLEEDRGIFRTKDGKYRSNRVEQVQPAKRAGFVAELAMALYVWVMMGVCVIFFTQQIVGALSA
jgi:hypothetical protein